MKLSILLAEDARAFAADEKDLAARLKLLFRAPTNISTGAINTLKVYGSIEMAGWKFYFPSN